MKNLLGSRTFQVLSNFTHTVSLNCTVIECQCFHLVWWSEKLGKFQIGLNNMSLTFIQFLKLMKSCPVLFAHAPCLMCSPILHQIISGFFTRELLESKNENRRSHSSERTHLYFQNSLLAKASHKSSPGLRNGEIDSLLNGKCCKVTLQRSVDGGLENCGHHRNH